MNWRRQYLHPRSGRRSRRLRDLYSLCAERERALEPEYFERYGAGRGAGGLTLFRGIRAEGAALSPAAPAIARGDAIASRLLDCLVHAVAAEPMPIHVAVSGGIDSWLLASILKSLGRGVQGWYLRSAVPGYCEYDRVIELAATLGIPFEAIEVTIDDFVDAVPRFLEAAETPIYNLHPVSKLLLAEQLRLRGVTRVVAGDGADQVMSHNLDCDLLPLTMACFDAAGVTVAAPFLDESVLAVVDRPYPDKGPVRELAARYGLPAIPKRPTLFPDVPLPAQPRADVPGGALLRYSTALLAQSLEAQEPCAASPA